MIHWIGAVLIVCSCTTVGFAMALAQRREEEALRQMIQAMETMRCELQYRLTPLPELCRRCGVKRTSLVGVILWQLSEELEHQINPDVPSCMYAVLARHGQLPPRLRNALEQLGGSLGTYDEAGQIAGLQAVRDSCIREAEQMAEGREYRLRSYQTLGLCAGAALAILLV